MIRSLLRNLAVAFSAAFILLLVFAVTGHRAHVLPADASPLSVLLGAFALALGATAVEHAYSRLR